MMRNIVIDFPFFFTLFDCLRQQTLDSVNVGSERDSGLFWSCHFLKVHHWGIRTSANMCLLGQQHIGQQVTVGYLDHYCFFDIYHVQI